MTNRRGGVSIIGHNRLRALKAVEVLVSINTLSYLHAEQMTLAEGRRKVRPVSGRTLRSLPRRTVKPMPRTILRLVSRRKARSLGGRKT